MTCIVGIVNDGKVYMGGDSAGVGGWDLTVRGDKKIFKNGPCIFGFTSSFRMGQLLRYALTIPKRYGDVSVDSFMASTFVDAVRSCLKAGGFATTRDGAEAGGVFLVGYQSRLFRVDSDYQVGESVAGYDAVGCGESYAKGALYANAILDPLARVRQALECAEAHSAGVRGPFHMESQ